MKHKYPLLLFNFIYLSFILPAFASESIGTTADLNLYCIAKGGSVEMMDVQFDTRAGRVHGLQHAFCSFQVAASSGYVAIGLQTFAGSKANLAATYAIKLLPIEDASPLWHGSYDNPSLNVCKNLGGATLVGSFTNTSGAEADICVFSDGSMISAWSLIYMANGRAGYDIIKNAFRPEALDMPLSP
jgi:putative hemolysin